MKDETLELIRHLAAECGVALDRGDPLVIAQAATQFIVRKALETSEKATTEGLLHHRQELEAISAKWNAEAKLAAATMIKEAADAIAAAVAKEHGEAFRIASEHFDQARKRQQKDAAALKKSRWVAVGAAAVSIIAALFAL